MRFLWPAAVLACSSGVGDIPPTPGDAEATTTTTITTFAIDSLLLGDTTSLDAAPTADAWKRFGYNLDGVSSNDCTGHAQSEVEGDDGIDNAFGAMFVPMLQTTTSNSGLSLTTTQFLQSGATSLVLRVTGLSNEIAQTATGLSTEIGTGATIAMPSFTSTMSWPTISGSAAHFSQVYVANGLIVARTPDATVDLTLPFNGVPFAFRIHSVVVTFRRTSTSLDGTIAGTLETKELIEALQSAAGNVSPSLCGTAFDGVKQQINEMQDILFDGTNAPGVACNAISIGLKFTATQIANDQTTVDVPSPPDPCAADAGTD